jgi:hypothetical protein
VGVMRFTRTLAGDDAFDWPVSTSEATKVLVAYSDSGKDELSYHGPTREVGSVSFGENDTVDVVGTQRAEVKTDGTSWTQSTGDATTPQQTDSTTTQSTDSTADSTTQPIVSTQPIISTTPFVSTTKPNVSTKPNVATSAGDVTVQSTNPPNTGTPETSPSGATGSPDLNGMTLKMAVVVFRGGIRTPVMALPGTMRDWAGKGVCVII